MAVGREIKRKIGSIKNTQKITSAMQLVAASKMRKAQERMQRSRPYATKIRNVIRHIAKSRSEYRHPYLLARPEIKRVGYIVISTDRGLCGGLNINLFRNALTSMKTWRERKVDVDLCVIGRKGQSFFSRFGGNVIATADHLGDSPSVADIIGVVKVMLDRFDSGDIDALYLVYNEFVNTMTQQPKTIQLLPITISEEDEKENKYWDYIYEPDAKEILDILLKRFIESQVYQGVIENGASEQSARMVAMKNATENAGALIEELQLIYNKARQAAITQEIAEIVSGAAAV